jgi:uncharacterized RDD family membrane protein YckC
VAFKTMEEKKIVSDQDISNIESNIEVRDKDNINKKPHRMLRIAGGLIDMFLLFLATFGLYQLELSIPISDSLKATQTEMVDIANETLLETNYGHKIYSTDEKYSSYNNYREYEDDEGKYKVIVYTTDDGIEKSELEARAEAYKTSITSNTTYSGLSFNYKFINYGLVILAGGISELVFLFIVPLTNKRRATLGKLAAGTQLISYKLQTRAKWWQVLIRFLWCFIIESALPFLFLNEMIIPLAIPSVLLVIMLFSKNTHRTLHDYVSGTMVIDKKTFLPITEQ